MIPEVVIHYVSPRTGERIAKAAFSNANDAIIFWNALPEGRRRHMLATDFQGDEIVVFTHVGEKLGEDGVRYYSHAAALTQALQDKYYSDRSRHTRRTFIDTTTGRESE